MTGKVAVEDLLRELTPQVLGAVVRRYGHFDAAEDAVQEALLAAAVQWPAQDRPGNPRAWLITVASRRLTDQLRADDARQRYEASAAALVPPDEFLAPAADEENPAERDDTLRLLFLCCHPALSPTSQVAITLRAVGGLTTAEIASAFLVPEATMGQRISRAKQRIRVTGIPFRMPRQEEWDGRLRAVLRVLYLIFNEGYTATSGPDLQRTDLTVEAIRLTRAVHNLLPDDGEVAGLLALMLLTDARRAARTLADGTPVPLAEQERSRWTRAAIAEGAGLLTETLAHGQAGPYQVQAAIAAVHDEAACAEDTDWPQILGLYDVLERLTPGPVVTLNRAVAVGMVHGPRAALDLLASVEADGRLEGRHRLDAVRAHLLEMAGDHGAARAHYEAAARLTGSLPERRYLETRAARLGGG
ncbi:MAG TPA: sigma-70 family RNA polymerase sigma factor [Candidatus Dormibacteraeota bacterium]|nr:sigma-70 family RNA polymerase sigma factor [Candidatus Dormibacteraeota bacterium]